MTTLGCQPDIQLQSLQLQRVSDNLFRANKYLAPKDSKTWNYLLNRQRDQSSDLDLDFQPVESDAENSNSLDPDITAPESPEHDLDSLNDQPSDTPAPEPPQLDRVLSNNSKTLPAPQLDVYGQPNTQAGAEAEVSTPLNLEI